MKKGNKRSGGIFGFGTGQDPVEQFLSYMIYHAIMDEEDKSKEDDDSWSSYTISNKEHKSEEEDDEWRLYCEDGSDIGVDPYDYDTEDDYLEALEKYKWRKDAEDGKDYDLSPLKYENESDYEADLNLAKLERHFDADDGSEYGLNPLDYADAAEYEEALEEAREQWRCLYANVETYGLNPYTYDSREWFERDLAYIRQVAKNEWQRKYKDRLIYPLDPENYETEEGYLQDLDDLKYGWREECEEGRIYGVDPTKYETEEEYEEALENAKRVYYGTERKYEAALRLKDIQDGYCRRYDKETREKWVARATFILNNPDVLAANYLTIDGGFLYAQAIKEHFSLPVVYGDEDGEVEIEIGDALEEIAERDPQLAFDAWTWCIRVFGPFNVYEEEKGCVTSILNMLDALPADFVEKTIDLLHQDRDVLDLYLGRKDCSWVAVGLMVSRLLQKDDIETATYIADSFCKRGAKDVASFAGWMIRDSYEIESIEALERERDHILPIVEQLAYPSIQKAIPRWKREIDDKIDKLEYLCDKYAFTRRYAWRANCRDGSEYDLNPLEYETEEAYSRDLDEAIEEAHSTQKQGLMSQSVGNDSSKNETKADQKAKRPVTKGENANKERPRISPQLQKKIDEAIQIKLAQNNNGREPQRTNTRDPFAADDNTEYTFCGVRFLSGSKVYQYRTDDKTITVGDRVIVPVGTEGKEVVAIVEAVKQYTRAHAPYPLNEVKKIIRKLPPDESRDQ